MAWKWFSCLHPVPGGRAPFTLVHLIFDLTGHLDDGLKGCGNIDAIPEADKPAGAAELVCSGCLEYAQHLIAGVRRG